MDVLLWSIPAVMDINKCPVYFIFLIIEHHQGIFEGEQAGSAEREFSHRLICPSKYGDP